MESKLISIKKFKGIFYNVNKIKIALLILVQILVLFISPLILKVMGISIDNFAIDWNKAMFYAIFYIILTLIISIINIFCSILRKKVVINIEYNNRKRFINMLMSKEWTSVIKLKHGQLIQLFFNQIGEMSEDANNTVEKFLEVIISTIWIGYLTLRINWVIGLVLFIILPFAAYFSLKSANICLKTAKQRQIKSNTYMSILSEIVENTKEIVLISQQYYFIKRHKKALEESTNAEINHMKSVLKYRTAETGAKIVCLVTVSILGIYMICKKKMTSGDMVVLFGYSTTLLIQLTQINYIKDMWIGIKVIQENLDKIYNLPKEKNGTVILKKNNNIKNIIDIKGLNFKYNDKIIFNNFNLKVKRGDFVVIKGHSGVGKTTLFRLLLRLIYKQSGQIKIEGYDIDEIEISSLHNYFACLSQNPFVFDDTIVSNIIYGRDVVDNKSLRDVIDKAYLPTELLDRKTIGENGKLLSGGEKQRLALARALMKDAEIILADEPASQLDEENEINILNTLKDLKGKKTILLISHRKNAEKLADKIVWVGEGNEK